jgi:hypothetical protein
MTTTTTNSQTDVSPWKTLFFLAISSFISCANSALNFFEIRMRCILTPNCRHSVSISLPLPSLKSIRIGGTLTLYVCTILPHREKHSSVAMSGVDQARLQGQP